MILLDGKAFAAKRNLRLKDKVAMLREETGIIPGLAAVRVGDDDASRRYVNSKAKRCSEIGMHSETHELPGTTSQAELVECIETLNQKESIHGILVQLPLPKSLDSDAILERIAVKKDVDGFHPVNVGYLVAGKDGMVPCTPLGIMRLLEHFDIPLAGKHAVVLGRSNIVGKPMAQLLLRAHATVTICHSRTENIEEMARSADVLVSAMGRAEVVGRDWVKPGAAVIDVGINRNAEGKLVGDVVFDQVKEVAGWLTPVPGGVGPLTIAMLLENTYEAARKQGRS